MPKQVKRYKCKINEEDQGFVFVLLPNNHNTQFVGRSKLYKTYEEAHRELCNFQTFVFHNAENIQDFIKIDYNNKVLSLNYKEGHLFYQKAYSAKKLCREWYDKVLNIRNAKMP